MIKRADMNFSTSTFQLINYIVFLAPICSVTRRSRSDVVIEFSFCKMFLMWPWRSADVLSGRHIVRVTFCHGFLIDVLSGRHFVSTYFVRHFVRKTFCQFSFFVVGFCIDVLSGRQIVSILTIFLVCWHYLWYVYVISGILTIFLVCWHYCPKNGQKWTRMA